MTFPISPTDGEKTNVNGVTYTYSATREAWTVTSNFLDTFTGNALVANSATIANSLSVSSGVFFGNVSGGNLSVSGNVVAENIDATGSISSEQISASDTITTGNLSAGGTISAANLGVTGVVSVSNVVATGSVAANSVVGNSISTVTNLTFTGAAARITGDFSNATISNRILFQTTTADSQTSIGAIPNGSSTTTNLNLFGGTDTGNAAIGQMVNTGSEVRLGAIVTGSGAFLPITFYTGGNERGRIDVNGNVGVGTDNPTERMQVAGNVLADNFTASGNVNSLFYYSQRTITANTVIGNVNAMSAGPIIIASGVTVTVSDGGEWSVV